VIRISLGVAAALLVVSLAGTAVAGPRVTVRDSTGKHKYKPTTLKFAFPALAPPFKITKLRRWKDWTIKGGPTTRAKGWLHYDDCKPNCAEGHYKRRRAGVFLFAPHRCHGRLVFRAVRVVPLGLPAHTHRIKCSGILRS
jgi:hypothetical protein